MKLAKRHRWAVKQFYQRKRLASKRKRIKNEDLVAGSPMYYYCKACMVLIAILPETHIERPPQLCEQCKFLVDNGVMPEGEYHA